MKKFIFGNEKRLDHTTELDQIGTWDDLGVYTLCKRRNMWTCCCCKAWQREPNGQWEEQCKRDKTEGIRFVVYTIINALNTDNVERKKEKKTKKR